MKQRCVDYKGGVCQICGYDKYIEAFDFHHRDRETKEFEISAKLRGTTFEKLKSELDKCDLLCCRCHREVEAEKKR